MSALIFIVTGTVLVLGSLLVLVVTAPLPVLMKLMLIGFIYIAIGLIATLVQDVI